SLALELPAPINIIAGENEAGKSSIRDAVQWCLTGQARGLKTHQEQAALIRNGGKAAEVTITLADKSVITRRKTPKSPATLTGEVPGNGLPPAVLCDPYIFLSLPENQRRELLFQIIPGLNPTKPALAERLKQWLKNESIEITSEVEENINRLAEKTVQDGFNGAYPEAVILRREAKRLQEHLGNITPPDQKCVLGPDNTGYILPDINVDEVKNQLKTLNAQRDELVKRKGHKEFKEAKARAIKTTLVKLKADLPESVGDAETATAMFQNDVSRLKAKKEELEAKLRVCQEPEHFPKTCPVIRQTQTPCPRAGESIGGTVGLAEIHEAKSELERVVTELADAKTNLKNIEEKIKTRRDTKNQIAKLEKELADLQKPTAETSPDLKEKIADLDDRIELGQELLVKVKDFWAQHNHYQETKEQITRVEQEIKLFDTLAKALAPDGIPSQMIAEALEPVNKLLATAAHHLFPGRALTLTRNLDIELSGSPYTTLSKSAKFRVGVGFQYTLAKLAGDRLLMIDEADVLDHYNRANLIDFLAAIMADFENIMVFATSDHVHHSPLPEIQVWWLKDGQIAKVGEQMAA
ncbi:MAG: hypothetical protein ACLFUU_12030, partial [Desulfobacteraceae bacterium]